MRCTGQCTRMPKTPNFVFRLPTPEREALIEMSKLYGAESPSAFLRDMIGAMCSGDLARVKEFNGRLVRAAGEQLILTLNAAVDSEPSKAEIRPSVPKRVPRRGARAKRRS